MNLEELLMEQNDFEEEEKEEKENINNNEQNNINIKTIKKDEKNSDYSSKSIKRYNDYDIDAEIDTNPNFLMLCPMKLPEKKHQKSNNLKIYKNPFPFFSPSKSQTSLTKNKKKKNAKSVINGGIISSKNYYKIFFFILLKAIIINRNIKEFFKHNDFDLLYEECQNLRIPFNQYEEWIINKFKLNGDKSDKNLYDTVINDCFICSSLI